jgi:hypothetical protein
MPPDHLEVARRIAGLFAPLLQVEAIALAGKAVLVIEYRPARSAFCPTLRALRFDGIRKHLSLDAYRAGC